MIPVYVTQAAAGAAWPGRGRELRIESGGSGEKEALRRWFGLEPQG